MPDEKLASRWLISTDWLAAHLNDPNVVVLDGSYYLANAKRDAEGEFLAGHIPRAQRFDIGAALAPAGQHQHRVREDLAPVVHRQPLPGRRDRRRQRVAQAHTIREGAQRVQTDMGHHPLAVRLDPHPPRAVTVHLSGALPRVILDVSQHRECPAGRALSRPGYLRSSHAR